MGARQTCKTCTAGEETNRAYLVQRGHAISNTDPPQSNPYGPAPTTANNTAMGLDPTVAMQLRASMSHSMSHSGMGPMRGPTHEYMRGHTASIGYHVPMADNDNNDTKRKRKRKQKKRKEKN